MVVDASKGVESSMAPEGSEGRAASRAILLRSALMAVGAGQNAVEWLGWAREQMSATVALVGERDMEAIVKFAIGKRRPRRW